MTKSHLIVWSAFVLMTAFASGQAAVHVEPSDSQSPRLLEKQTEAAVIRDYLQAWKGFNSALDQNRADLLNQDFVGTAKDKLTATIQDQAKLGLHTRYQDRAHDLTIIFYSPEGLSIQLIDNVEYDVQVLAQDKVLTTQRVKARYIAVLTPSEVRWRVRMFQSTSE